MTTNAVMGTNRRGRHRSWPESLKREIVAASLVPGASVSRLARRYDVNANQVFAWRRRYRDGAAEPAELRLLPVTVTPDYPRGTAPAGASEVIEIVLAGGYRVCVGVPVGRGVAVGRVIAASHQCGERGYPYESCDSASHVCEILLASEQSEFGKHTLVEVMCKRRAEVGQNYGTGKI